MDGSTIVVAIIAVAGVIFTAFVTWFIAQRQIMTKYVTEERAKWRDRIRKQALKAYDAILCGDNKKCLRFQSEFRALLNPLDRDDQMILCCMNAEGKYEDRQQKAKAFSEQISLLLKHDWERAKLEAGFFLRRWMIEAKRTSWSDIKSNNERDTREDRRCCRSCPKCCINSHSVLKWFGVNTETQKLRCNNVYFICLLFVVLVLLMFSILAFVFVASVSVCAASQLWSVLVTLCAG